MNARSTTLALAALALAAAGCGSSASATMPAGTTSLATTAASSPAASATTASATAPSQTPAASSTAPDRSSPSAPSSPAADAIPVEVIDFKVLPAAITSSGKSVTLAVTNAGPTVHNIIVRDDAGTVLFGTRELREGESETVSGELAPGTYITFCSLPGHESLGIKGTLTVRG